MYLSDLYKLIAEVLEVSEKDINENTNLQDIPSWDSMNHMILIAKLEEKYKILFTGDEIIEMIDVKSIKYMLNKKGCS